MQPKEPELAANQDMFGIITVESLEDLEPQIRWNLTADRNGDAHMRETHPFVPLPGPIRLLD